MPKAQAFNEALQAVKNKIPRGMFSTLDELIAAHPTQKATAEQWANYLKPGQTLTREGVSFPLKQEELDYTGLSDFFKNIDPKSKDAIITGAGLRKMAQRQRPAINRDIDPTTFRDYSHNEEPGSEDEYSADITTSPDFGDYPTHFSPQALSWSRTTSHVLPNDGGALRLIDEIQSDRHARAAEKIDTPRGKPVSRVGYRTPEQQEEMHKLDGIDDDEDQHFTTAELTRLQDLMNVPPDAPFKGAADYGSLEMKKQLLNAVRESQDYLGIVRGDDQVGRYPGLKPDQQEGMRYGYDKVYRGVLEKLGRQYGAPMTEIQTQIPAARGGGKAPPSMGAADIHDFVDDVSEYEPDEYHEAVSGLLKDYQGLPVQSTAYENHLRGAQDKLRRFQNDPESDATPALQGAIESHLQYLDGEWNKFHRGPITTGTKSFPAIQLTPEIREKVRKAGVPIWAAAGAGTGLDVLKQQLDSDEDATRANDPEMQFAEGGNVSSLHKLRGYLDQIEGKQNAQSDSFLARHFANEAYTLGPDGKPVIGTHPGIIDQTLSLPGLINPVIAKVASTVLGNKSHLSRDPEYAAALKKMEHTLGDTPGADAASARTEALDAGVKKELGIDKPTSMMDRLGDAEGSVASMIPVPGAASKFGKAAQTALESVGPAITPKLSHYLGWGAANFGIGEIPELMASKAHDDSHLPPTDPDTPTVNMMADAGYSRGGNVQERMMNGRKMQCGGLAYAAGGQVPALSGVPNIDSQLGPLITATRTPTSPTAGTQRVAAPVATTPMAGQYITLPGGQVIHLPGGTSTGNTTVGGTPASVPASGVLGGNTLNGQNLLTNGTGTPAAGGSNVTPVGAQDISHADNIYSQARERLARLFHSPYANPKGYAGGGPVDPTTSDAVKQVYRGVKSGEMQLADGISALMSQLNIDQGQARSALQALSNAGY